MRAVFSNLKSRKLGGGTDFTFLPHQTKFLLKILGTENRNVHTHFTPLPTIMEVENNPFGD